MLNFIDIYFKIDYNPLGNSNISIEPTRIALLTKARAYSG